MLAFEVRRREGWASRLANPLAAVIAAVGLVFAASRAAFPYHPLQLALFGAFFTTVACGASLGGVLRLRGASLLGECSYSIYLLHGIVLDLLFTEGAPLWRGLGAPLLPLLLPVAGLGVLAAASLNYLCVERPALRLGSRIARRGPARQVDLADPQLEVAP